MRISTYILALTLAAVTQAQNTTSSTTPGLSLLPVTSFMASSSVTSTMASSSATSTMAASSSSPSKGSPGNAQQTGVSQSQSGSGNIVKAGLGVVACGAMGAVAVML